MDKKEKPLSISINKKESATGAVVVTGEKTAEVINTTSKMEVSKPTEQVTLPTVLSIEELQAKAEKTAQMVERYQKIKAKKALVDRFVILHEIEGRFLKQLKRFAVAVMIIYRFDETQTFQVKRLII